MRRDQTFALGLLCILAITAGCFTPETLWAQSSQPASDAAMANTAGNSPAPTSVPASAPAVSESKAPVASKKSPPAAKSPAQSKTQIKDMVFRFQYDGVPYTNVIRRFAQAVGKPLMGELNIDGALTFFDAEPYTYAEALDTLNLILAMRGQVLREEGRFLRLRPLREVPATTKILKGLDDSQAKNIRPNEIVTVVLPVKYLDPADLSKSLVRMVGSYGSISPLGKGKGVIVTDTLASIKRIRGLIQAMDAEELADYQVKTIILKNASASSAANIINKLFGAQSSRRMVWNQQRRRMVPAPPDPKDMVTVSSDERTNMVILAGAGAKISQAEQMLQRLDKTDGPTPGDMRIFKLEKAQAEELASVLQKAFPKKREKGAPNTQIVPDRATNRLIVSAPHEQMLQLERLIRELDAASTAQASSRIIQLKEASAAQLVKAVLNATGKRKARGGFSYTISATAEPQTNSLIIAGAPKNLDLAEEIIKKLDRKGESKTKLEVRIVQLESGNVWYIRDAVSQLLREKSRNRGKNAPRPNVQVEPDTNSLIIAATSDDWKDLDVVLKQLQSNAKTRKPLTKFVTLKYAKADQLARTLQNAVRSRSWGMKGKGAIPIYITPDANANALLVTANEEDQAEVARMVSMLDIKSLADQIEIRTYKLEKVKANEVARNLSRLFAQKRSAEGAAPPARFEAENTTNQIFVAAVPEQFKEIEKVIEELKNKSELTSKMQVFQLKYAKADKLLPVLEQMLLPEGGAKKRRWWESQGGVDTRIIAEPTANAILVQGSPETLAMADQLIKQFDSEEQSKRVSIQIVQLKNAQANTLAQSVSRALSDRQRGRANTITVTAEANANAILVRGPVSELPKVVDMIKQLDSESTSEDVQMRVYPLANSQAKQLATNLSRMFRDITNQQRRNRRGGQTPVPFSVAADERTNSLVISTTPAYFTTVEEMLKKLDGGEKSIRDVEYVFLQNADAIEVSLQLDDMFLARRYNERPLIKTDSEANALTLIGTDADLTLMRKVITKLDAAAALQAVRVRVVPLEDVSAARMAEMLQRIYGQMTDRKIVITSNIETSEKQPNITPTPQSQPKVITDAVPIRIAADTRANALLISGPKRDLDELERLTGQLSYGTTAADAELKIFTIEKADPTQIASTLDNLFNDKTPQRIGRRTVIPKPEITVLADPKTRRLIVRAKPRDLEVIEPLIKRLDSVETVLSEVRIFPLKNSSATEVAGNLRELFSLSAQTRSNNRRRRNAQQQRSDMVRQMIELTGGKDAKARVEAGTFVSITSNSKTNSLVVAAPAEAMTLIGQLIQELDQSAAEVTQPVVRLYPLKNAQVSQTVQALQRVFPTTRGRRQPGDTPVLISGDEAGKTVLVSASGEKQLLIAKVIEQLDAAQSNDRFVVKVYSLANAQAQQIAQALTQTVSSGPANRRGRSAAGQAIRIAAEPSNNSIIVRAETNDQERIAALIAEMDASKLAAVPVKMIPLRNAEASKMASMLNRLFSQQSNRGRRRGGAAQSVLIEADPSGQAIMVRADEKTFESIDTLARKLDASALVGRSNQTLMQLKHAKASSVATALTQAFAPKRGQRISPEEMVSVTAETNANCLIVTANETNLKKVKQLVDKLDTSELGGIKTELLLLENAQASELERVLSKIAGASGSRSRRNRRGGNNQEPVTISADSASNALLFSGPAVDVAKLVQMAISLDKASAESGSTGVYIIPLTNGDAESVTRMIADLYRQQVIAARRNRQTVEPLAVSADTRANAVVLAASKAMYKQVSDWVKQVEEMKPAKGRLKVVPLKNSNPDDVKKAIDQLFSATSSGNQSRGRRRNRGGSSGGRVEVSTLPTQKAIMISANDDDYQQIVELVKKLEAAAEAARRRKEIFTLKNASNQRVAQALSAMYRVRGRVSPEETVTITTVPNTNAVMVAAPKDKFEEISHLISQLDSKAVSPKLEFRVVMLEHASPTKVLPMLRQMLNQVRRARPGESIDIAADERTHSLIITAAQPVFEEVEKLIKLLDVKPAFAEADVLIIPLKRADSTRLAAVLNEMLRPSGNQVTREARALQEQIRRIRVKSALSEKIPELDLTKPIKISADPARPQGSNSLIIQSTQDNLKAIAAVVDSLDVLPITAGVTVQLIHLKNADAQSIATVIKQIFAEGKKLAGAPGSSTARRAEPESESGKALSREISVAADSRTNSLIIAGEEEVIALAKILIDDMDREKGKIVTEVRLFRLKHADAMRLSPILAAVFAEGRTVRGAEGLQTQVTRLMTYLEKKTGKSTKYPKNHPALTIRPDETTNTLVVAARSDVMPLIADVVTTMDIPGAGSMNTVRIFPLENADATRLQSVVSSLYTGPNAKFVRDEDKPTVTVDSRTNSLIVASSEKTFSMLEVLLKRLDSKSPVDSLALKLLPLKNSEAVTLAPVLQKMMDARILRQQSLGVKDAEALRVMISADARSNSLIVGGSTESFKLIESLAKQLDTAAPALGGLVQVLPLKEGNAGSIATTLQRLFDQRYQAARTNELQKQKPVILPDLRTNSLLVAANNDDSAILKSLLKKLDVKLDSAAVQLVVIPLKYNDAGVVGPTIQRLFQARLTSMTPTGQTPDPQSRVDVAADPLSNSLIVSASKENLHLINNLLKKVDVLPPDKKGVVRLYPLKNSDAQRVATMLQSLVSQGLYKPGLTGADAQSLKDREKVSIVVDARTNVLIISASRENFAVIEGVLERIDTSKDYALNGDIRTFVLKHANAVRLAPTLQQFFNQKRQAEQTTGTGGRSLPVVIVPDERTNTILVAGSRESFAAVDQMIKQLDAGKASPAQTFEIFTLKNATAAVLQNTLQDLFDKRATRGQTKDPVTILADTRANALIVGATAQDLAVVKQLLGKLDVVSREGEEMVKVFPLKKADAKSVLETLKNLYRKQGGGDSTITMSADERTNAIVVSAGKNDLRRIGEIIGDLDEDKVARITEIKVFPLDHADATELASILNDILNNKPKALTNVSQNRQTLLQLMTRTREGKDLATSALKEGVLITPDKRTNSLVISAPLTNMPFLSTLVKSMDNLNPQSAEIKVFTLVNSDAAQVATILGELFRESEAVGASRTKAAVTYKMQEKSGKTASMTTGQADQAALNITVDPRTNSLLIGGTKHQVNMAAAVIEKLDSSKAQERVTQVYHPKNAQAVDIQNSLRNFLDQERQRLVQALGNDRMGAAQRLLENEVAVVAEENTNTLLLSASPRYFSTLEKMLAELDRPAAQVLVQALLAEVKLDNTSDLGVDWSWQTKVSGEQFGVGSDFGVEAAIAGGATPGFNVSVTGGDLNFFLRALQTQDRLEILSRPQLLAADNQQATITVGQRVPLITNTRITDNNNVINTINYEQVGITLDVLPRIGSDGSVRMEVKPTISAIASQSVQITEIARAPYINNRTAETTVICQDAQTVIIGGLITTTDRDHEDKVPILGDIPIAGLLFRSTTKVKERNELMIFLTPNILRTPADQKAAALKEFKNNETLRILKMNHEYKKSALDTVNDPELLREIYRRPDTLPETAYEQRMENIRQSIMELELIPEQWRDDDLLDKRPVEQEVE